MTSSPAGNTLLLKRQLTELRKRPVDGFSAGLKDESNLFEWEIMIIGPNDTLYEGGFLRAELIFPPEYPLLPPKMKFITPMWHPNIYADGTVCISILHAPGKDEWGYEDASERWLPVHTVESIVSSNASRRVYVAAADLVLTLKPRLYFCFDDTFSSSRSSVCSLPTFPTPTRLPTSMPPSRSGKILLATRRRWVAGVALNKCERGQSY